MTRPSSMSFENSSTIATWKSWASSRFVASSCILPTTFGRFTGGGPLLTTNLTSLPLGACEVDGSWLSTEPAGMS